MAAEKAYQTKFERLEKMADQRAQMWAARRELAYTGIGDLARNRKQYTAEVKLTIDRPEAPQWAPTPKLAAPDPDKYTWFPSLSYYVTPMSCGVREVQGFSRLDNTEDGLRDIIAHLKSFWKVGRSYWYGQEGNRLPCAVLNWSDQVGRLGDEVAKYIAQEFPHSPPVMIYCTNPANGHDIVVVSWKIPANITEHPLWVNLEIEAKQGGTHDIDRFALLSKTWNEG